MPNWVTNRITAPKHVIHGMLNAEGRVDFSAITPFPGPNSGWSGVYGDAETAAEIACNIPVSEHPMLASLETANRRDFDIRKMRQESFDQFVGMLENYRACGYLHEMDFARQVWGTKWNACEPEANPDDGEASFDTAWSCPIGVLSELSKRFPADVIQVTYADEDIGSNCGTFTLTNGDMVEKDIAPDWSDQTDEEREKWNRFAYEVKGWEQDKDEEE